MLAVCAYLQMPSDTLWENNRNLQFIRNHMKLNLTHADWYVTRMIQQMYSYVLVTWNISEFWGVNLWGLFTFSPLSRRVVMGPELMVAMSLTVVPWLSLTLRRLLELVPVVQFYRWMDSILEVAVKMKNTPDYHHSFPWKHTNYCTLKLSI